MVQILENTLESKGKFIYGPNSSTTKHKKKTVRNINLCSYFCKLLLSVLWTSVSLTHRSGQPKRRAQARQKKFFKSRPRSIYAMSNQVIK